jgi:hypothetical protein
MHSFPKKSFLQSKQVSTLMAATVVIQALSICWLLNRSQPNVNKSTQELTPPRETAVVNKSVIEEPVIPNPESIPASRKNQGSEPHLLTTIEIFRRFALLAPVPSKTPYNLANPHATYYSDSTLQQDRKMDELLKQRERGFFIEVG